MPVIPCILQRTCRCHAVETRCLATHRASRRPAAESQLGKPILSRGWKVSPVSTSVLSDQLTKLCHACAGLHDHHPPGGVALLSVAHSAAAERNVTYETPPASLPSGSGWRGQPPAGTQPRRGCCHTSVLSCQTGRAAQEALTGSYDLERGTVAAVPFAAAVNVVSDT